MTTPLGPFLATNLTADGYRVTAAADGSKAIALLSVDQPDLIIADVNGQRSISSTLSAAAMGSPATWIRTRR